MSDPLTRVRNAVCGIGYLTVPAEEYARVPEASKFEIMGTGFLVGIRRAVTCAHVLKDMRLRMQQRQMSWDERAHAYFVYPAPSGSGWRTDLVRFTVDVINEESDIALFTPATQEALRAHR